MQTPTQTATRTPSVTVTPTATRTPVATPTLKPVLADANCDGVGSAADFSAAIRVSADENALPTCRGADLFRGQQLSTASFLPRIGLTSSVEVAGLSTPIVMTDQSVEVIQPAALRPQMLALRFRLVLNDNAVPGTYAMPVQVSVSVL